MEPNQKNARQNDPASTPEEEREREPIGRQFFNQLQFEEAVMRLCEEYERHPHPPKGMFY